MVRIRLYGLVLSLPIIIAVVSIAWAFLAEVPIWSGIPAVHYFLGLSTFLQLLFALIFACPRCGKSPYAFGPFLGPLSFGGKPWPDDKCSNCGHDFTGRNSA